MCACTCVCLCACYCGQALCVLVCKDIEGRKEKKEVKKKSCLLRGSLDGCQGGTRMSQDRGLYFLLPSTHLSTLFYNQFCYLSVLPFLSSPPFFALIALSCLRPPPDPQEVAGLLQVRCPLERPPPLQEGSVHLGLRSNFLFDGGFDGEQALDTRLSKLARTPEPPQPPEPSKMVSFCRVIVSLGK